MKYKQEEEDGRPRTWVSRNRQVRNLVTIEEELYVNIIGITTDSVSRIKIQTRFSVTYV